MSKNFSEQIITEQPESSHEIRPKIIKLKPLVEGINAPFATESRPGVRVHSVGANVSSDMRPSASSAQRIEIAKRPHGIRNTIFAILILAVLLGGVYQTYMHLHKKPIEPKQYNQSGFVNYGNATNTPSRVAETSTPSSLVVAPATTSAATIAVVAQVQIKQTPTGFLNVRTQPSQSGNIVAKVMPGETYHYLELKKGWYLISLPNNLTGWVNGQYITVLE